MSLRNSNWTCSPAGPRGHDHLRGPEGLRPPRPPLVQGAPPTSAGQRHRGATGSFLCPTADWVDWGCVGVWLVPDRLWCVQLRRAFRSIRNALPQIFYVFLLFMFSLLIFSLMALKLLGKRCESCSLAVSCGCGLCWAELQLKGLGCFWTEA